MDGVFTESPDYAMARIRSMHPGAPLEEDVATMSLAARYVWAYLPCHADREGRLRDAPFSLQLLILPTEPAGTMDAALSELAEREHVIRYEVSGRKFIQIRSFATYQHPHPREAPSEIPPVPSNVLSGLSHVKALPGNVKAVSSPSSPDQDPSPGPSRDPDRGADPEGAPARVANGKPVGGRIWGPADWLKRYGAAWAEKYKQLAYGMPGDSKACAALGDTLGVLPESEKLAAQGIADRMFAEFLDSSDPRVVSRRHPFAFFVQEWGGLRVEKKPQTTPDKFEPISVRLERERKERARARRIELITGGVRKP